MTKSNVWHTAGTILLITGIISFAIMLAILIWGHGSIYFLSFHVIGSTCMISLIFTTWKRDKLEREEKEIIRRLKGYD
jgi:hypothetical protein